MHQYNYEIVEPYDISVFFNVSLINTRVSIPISIKRKKYQKYLDIRSRLKYIIIKILKRLKFV